MALVNGVGIRKLVRKLAPSGGGRLCSVGRVYERILWLEKPLLAFKRTQLARWKSACESSGVPARHHLAHDDIVLTVNWETASDRHLTQLNCSTTADVRSGYVYRIDVDFDPTVDPITMFEKSYVDPTDGMKNLRMAYSQKSGLTFTAPRMEFQRPTGRLDEHHFFASAANQLRVFRDQAGERMPTRTQAERNMRDATLHDLERRMNLIDTVHNDYFNLRPSRRDYRTPFSGVMTRDVYTKAAHFILLREMLPKGVFRLVTEQEGMLPRVLPVAFRDEIRNDRFIWLATTFDKEVKKPRYPFAHIGGSAGKVDADAGPGTDHAFSTARINCVSATVSMLRSKRRLRPPGRRSSTGVGNALGGASGMAGTSCAGGMSNGRNSASRSGDHSPFFFKSCR